jgi:ATP-binding cassette subfamily B multidrug efflux pump
MKSSVFFILSEILKERVLLFSGLGLTLLGSLMTWASPVTMAGIIDEGLVPGDLARVRLGVLLLAGAEFSRLAASVGGQLIYARLGQNVIERIRKKMVSHLISLPVPYFDHVTSGGMMTRVVNDANSLTEFFQSGFVSVLGNLGSLLAAFIGLFALSPKLGGGLFLVFIPFVWASARFSRQLRRVYEEMRSRLSELNSQLADLLFGMRTLRALGLNARSHEALRNRIEAYAQSQRGMIRTYALFHPTITLATGIFLLLLMGFGLPLVEEGELKVGGWIAALSYILMMQQPMTEISDRWNFFLAGLTSIGRVKEVLDAAPEPSGESSAGRFETLRFENCSFRYPGAERLALRQVNLEIRRGDWVGVFGESGSGKSTLLQILMAFLEPSEGRMLWNGVDGAQMDRASLRARFGVVEQFPFLFSGTIEENITWFGSRSWDRKALLERFRGKELIVSLLERPRGRVSERGANLSLGEKQMITFLRAWLARPEFWILDEATAFFDPQAESELLAVLEEERASGVTVIQVAHRPEALRRMGRWISLCSGDLQERTAAELRSEQQGST